MGNFGRAVKFVENSMKKAAESVFYKGATKIPNIVKPAMGQAQKRMVRRLTKQYIPPSVMRIKKVSPMSFKPVSSDPVYSPHFGKLIPQRRRQGDFVASKPGLAERQPMRPSLFWKMSDSAKTFFMNRKIIPGTTMPMHSSQVGSMSPLYRKN